MTRDRVVSGILATGLVPCWRCDDTAAVIDATRSLGDAGMTTAELTMTMPGALRLIERAAAELPSLVIGAGTVLDAETARLAILAGARYVVSPCLVPEVVATCHRYEVPVVIGAFSATEVLAAKALGADLIKLYHAGMGGPGYVAELVSVFPGVRLVVSGGVMLADVADFLAAGAAAAVVGMPQIAATAYAERRFDEVARVAARLIAIAREARQPEARRRRGEEALARYADLDRGQSARASAAR